MSKVHEVTDPDGCRLEAGVNHSFGYPSVTIYVLDKDDGEEGAVRLTALQWVDLVEAVRRGLAEMELRRIQSG